MRNTSTTTRRNLVVVALAAVISAAPSAMAEDLPAEVGGRETITSAISPVGDVDEFNLDLMPGDRLTVTLRDLPPVRGLEGTLTLFDADNGTVPADIRPGAAGRQSLRYTVPFDVEANTHRLRLVGGPGEFLGSNGDYQVGIRIRRGRPARATLAFAAGGPINYRFAATANATINLRASTRRGGLVLTDLLRPDGSAEPGFADALRAARSGRAASLRRFVVTGGFGTYTLVGTYEAGSKVKLSAKVRNNLKDKRTSTQLRPLEPGFDPIFGLLTREGVPGIQVRIEGTNLFTEGEGPDEVLPSFFFGSVQVPPDEVESFSQNQYRVVVPQALSSGFTYDVSIRNPDGQRVVERDAFTYVHTPNIQSLDIAEGGPAGGREIRITASQLRGGVSVLFDNVVVQPDLVLPGTMRVDVKAPAHVPGTVDVSLRDEFGQISTLTDAYTYLDVGSNEITSIGDDFMQGIGGQVVTVNGADFDATTVLTLDRRPLDHTLVSPTQLTFLADARPSGTFELRVEDQYQQSSTLSVEIRGFTDATDTAIPAPLTAAGAIDGWRATRVLTGDVTGDLIDDLVLLRSDAAFGDSINRPRIRILAGDGAGGFSDATSGNIPDVSAGDDWRALDGVLIDFDDDNDLDVALITTAVLETDMDGDPSRSSLRFLANNGSGGFTDVTSTSAPALADYGDHNQGVAIVAADFDGENGVDLAILHTDYFTETIVIPAPEPPAEPDPEDPPPMDEIITTYFPGLRILLNDGNGVFTRDIEALPEIDAADQTQFQGGALAVGDPDDGTDADLLLTFDAVNEDVASPSNYHRSATFLENDGTGVFTDESDSVLPSPTGPEFLQGSVARFIDVNGDDEVDLVIASPTRLVTPDSGSVSFNPATRVFENDGSGVFDETDRFTFPDPIGNDAHQANAFAIGDLSGDGDAEFVLLKTTAPVIDESATRVLVSVGDDYAYGTDGLATEAGGRDLRGSDVVLLDIDGDGDLDIVIVRSESNETIRNTRVLINPRNTPVQDT